ncbi:hypothetical protein LTR95_009698 [Oleoguttula sp. CCFEE 5521]
MDLAAVKLLAPQIPSLANTAVWHTFGMTPNGDKWDLRTTLTVQVLRSFMTGGGKKPSSIGKVQAATLKDPGVKGKTWVAKATIPAPKESEEGVREAVFGAVDAMAEGQVQYTKPGLVDIGVEWTGYRSEAGANEVMPNISEEERYAKLMAEPTRTSDTTVLYFHGGAYYLCDPASHRAVTSRLAKECNGRVCSVRYRLAPQTAFPAQLLDALMVYLSLIHPPPGSLHTAIPASHIVLGGDSAGGNLVFALLQLLLQLHRTSSNPQILFHGRKVDVPLPAGASANSGWFDIARAMPSIATNTKYDYLPPVNHDDTLSRFPADNIWPANPPRGDLFCDLSLLDHPLVSPLLAADWSGSPPLWFVTGEECLTDEDTVVAARAAKQGVKVWWEQYEAMPHCFGMLIPTLANSGRCMRSWGEFCRKVVEAPSEVQTKGVWISAKGGVEKEVRVQDVASVEDGEVRRLVKDAKERRLRGWEKEGKGMPKPAL